MDDILELGPDGWLRQGSPWISDQPFYAVLGDPIAHSLSPMMQGAALRERERSEEYLALKIRAGQLRSLKDGPAGKWLAGFNVTAPHKEAVAKLCDGRTDQARDLEAVNTVRVEDGKWLGHNTDSGGALTVLTQAWPREEPPVRGVVLGAGGSARAAVDALLRWKVESIEVRNRSSVGRNKFSEWLARRGVADRVRVIELEAGLEPPPESSAVWISCLAGQVATGSFLPPAAGPDPCLFLDFRYGDQLPSEAPPIGFEFSDGLPLLLMQGGLAFAWWFGPPVPWDAMRLALD